MIGTPLLSLVEMAGRLLPMGHIGDLYAKGGEPTRDSGTGSR